MSVSFYQFLSDDYQHHLKNTARQKTLRFHLTLFEYRKLFWDSFNNNIQADKCPILSSKTKDIKPDRKQIIFDWVNDFYDFTKSNQKEFDDYLQSLISVYDTYISGNITKSSIDLYKILESNNLFNTATDVAKYYPVFYRGRIKKNKITNIEDFYHIPFDELHKAKPYRFSITGQPMIYCGASLPTVCLELGDDKFNNPEMQYSFWAVKHYENLALYDITNQLHDLLSWNFISLAEADVRMKFENKMYSPSIKTAKVDFKKFILSQLCTFLKKHYDNQQFVEEYVFPQLVTEQIRNYKNIQYDGFIFPSTKYANIKIDYATNVDYPYFKNNIAFFSPYNIKDKFSQVINQKFQIHFIDNTKHISKGNFDKLMIDYKETKRPEVVGKPVTPEYLVAIKQALLSEYYSRVVLNGQKFADLIPIQIQFQSIINYLNTF